MKTYFHFNETYTGNQDIVHFSLYFMPGRHFLSKKQYFQKWPGQSNAGFAYFTGWHDSHRPVLRILSETAL